jgi:hypothetical protein
MAISKMVKLTVVVAAVALSACGGNDAADDSTTLPPGAVPTSNAAPTSTTLPANVETGEVPVSETLDPAGSNVGGTVGRSYLDDTYPTELTGIVGLAVADLADRLAIDESAITVVLVEEVAWSDRSLGCPQPGMSYAQVITDGLRFVLEADGVLYDYRSGDSSDPALCVQAPDKDQSRAGMFELTEDGDIIFVPNPVKETGPPTEGPNPPDK